jgi:hypothetical protein
MAPRRHTAAAPTRPKQTPVPQDDGQRFAAIAAKIAHRRVSPIPDDFLPLLQRHGRYLVDGVRVPFGEKFPICNTDYRVLTGTTATACPRAKPSLDVNLVETLADSLRRRGLVPRDSTIHWVGRQETAEAICCCDPDALQSAAEGRPAPRKSRLQVRGSTVILDGRAVPLNLAGASRDAVLCLLTHLLAAQGDWRSQTELDRMEDAGPCQRHVGTRWYRIVEKLPKPLRAVVETNRRKGNRLVPANFQSLV